jgi:hypothetical protein
MYYNLRNIRNNLSFNNDMKPQFFTFKTLTMKKIQAIMVLSLFLAAVSCKKTADPGATTGVTTDQVAAISAGSLSLASDGLATNSNDISSDALSNDQGCGTTVSDSTTKSGTSNNVNYNYWSKYTKTLTCNQSNEHDNIVYVLSLNGSYQGPNVSSTDTATSTFKIAGFTSFAQSFVINGEYKRTGKFTSNVGDKVSGTSSIDIVVTNLTVSKTTKNITGGTATITIAITTTKGTSNFNGPLTFNGDGTATLVINGTHYSINLTTGVVAKQS